MRIGLLGGSFDPPHHAHLALARAARDQLALDELRLMPAGAPWQKAGRDMAPAADRAAMVATLIEGEPRLALERWEIEQRGPTVTADTVQALQQRDGAQHDWFLVIGQDQYARFHTWRRWPELLQRVTLAVAGRSGTPVLPSDEVAAVPHRRIDIALPPMPDSSSAIRERLARGLPVGDMVPPAVARYIDRRGLYRDLSPRS